MAAKGRGRRRTGSRKNKVTIEERRKYLGGVPLKIKTSTLGVKNTFLAVVGGIKIGNIDGQTIRLRNFKKDQAG